MKTGLFYYHIRQIFSPKIAAAIRDGSRLEAASFADYFYCAHGCTLFLIIAHRRISYAVGGTLGAVSGEAELFIYFYGER